MNSLNFKISLFLIIPFCLFKSQYKISEIPKDGYLKDFEVAVNILEKQHPNPYRFHSKTIIDKKIDSLRNNIKNNPTYSNFMRNLPYKVFGDGHIVSIPNSNYYLDYVNNNYFFPINIYVQDSKAYVNDNNVYGLPKGSLVLSVNNESIESLILKSPKQKDGNINVEDVDLVSTISSNVKNKEHNYTIKYLDYDRNEKIITVPGVSYFQSVNNLKKSILPIEDLYVLPYIYGYQLSEDVFYLSVKTFNIDESFFYEMLKKYFTEIKEKNIHKIVIDIRNNGGGYIPNVPLLYSFLTKDKIFTNSYKYGTKVLDIQYSDYLIDGQTDRYLSEQDIRSENNYMRQRFDKKENSDYYYGNSRLDDTYVKDYPKDNLAYDGSVVLLINNKTFSSATYFASLFKKEKRGDIVGKETGSCSNFTTAANFIYYLLPNTKTKLRIPRMEIFYNTDMNDDFSKCTGVIPNYKIDNSLFIKSLKSEKDPELDFALDLLSK